MINRVVQTSSAPMGGHLSSATKGAALSNHLDVSSPYLERRLGQENRSDGSVGRVAECIRSGSEVVFVQQSSGTSPAAQMRLQMQGVFAAYEWALIRERTRRGRLFAARQGRVHWGPP